MKKHSQATKAVVRVQFFPKNLRVTITDSGCGFEMPPGLHHSADGTKLGLLGMQKRARLLGGTLSVTSQQGKGTVIAVDIST